MYTRLKPAAENSTIGKVAESSVFLFCKAYQAHVHHTIGTNRCMQNNEQHAAENHASFQTQHNFVSSGLPHFAERLNPNKPLFSCRGRIFQVTLTITSTSGRILAKLCIHLPNTLHDRKS